MGDSARKSSPTAPLTLLGLHLRFWDKSLNFSVACPPRKGTAVLEGLKGLPIS